MVSRSDFIAAALGIVRELVPVARAGASCTDKSVCTKRDGSLVTAIDQEVETRLVTFFNRTFPGVPVLGEEGAIDLSATSAQQAYGSFMSAGCQITIDPIDGTRNFIDGNPQYCIAVALSAGGPAGVWPRAGIVAIPEQQKIYWSGETAVWVEDLVTGTQRAAVSRSQAHGPLSVNSRDRAWLASHNMQLLVPWVSSGSSVYDFLGTILGRNRASIIGSQRLWDLMAPLSLATMNGVVLRDLQSGQQVRSIQMADLSTDIESRPWGLARKMVLAAPDLDLSQVVVRG